MAKYDWNSITREDVITAINLFLKGSPEYPNPRSTFLLYQGKKLPAKHIRGIAYKVAHNHEISKDDYAGGMETVRFFQKLGFEMYYTGETEKKVETTAPEKEEKQVSIMKEQKAIEVSNLKDIAEVKQNVTKIPKKSGINKIKIPVKGVIEQKNALQLILNQLFDGDIVCEKTYPWLKTPDTFSGEYIGLCDALTLYRGKTDFAKKNVVLRCDFVCEGKKLIFEYDERQHFSEARRVSLEAYRKVPIFFDREQWIQACQVIQARDSQPANRDEVRAFYDSTRDIEAAKHGYKLVRIMHGQIDFEKEDAKEQLLQLLSDPNPGPINATKLSRIKIAMYLQADQWKNQIEFDKAMGTVMGTDIDILVFPEFGWAPFNKMLMDSDITQDKDIEAVSKECLGFSKKIGRAVIISSIDLFGTIFSAYANAKATEEETDFSIYIKHTMTSCSAFEFEDYQSIAGALFSPIIYKDHWIGMTICYDCNHALFSRMYGVQGVDIIINSTGGNVVYDKWHKYNQSRAIENQCYTFVTMGGDGEKDKVNSYVYGFNPNGRELHPRLLNGDSELTNIPGGIYVYDLKDDDSGEEPENSINQLKTENKYKDFYMPVGNVDSILEQAEVVEKNLFVYNQKDVNIVFVVVEEDDIFRAESYLPLMYSDKLKKYVNRRYVIVNKYKKLDSNLYRNQLSIVLKVRAMENFCAVFLESDIENNCYQTGKSKTAQVLKPEDGMFGLDLSRMTGPEAIWKNKGSDFKASWRKNFVWLANMCKYIADNQKW